MFYQWHLKPHEHGTTPNNFIIEGSSSDTNVCYNGLVLRELDDIHRNNATNRQVSRANTKD